MNLWTWIANMVIARLQERFENLERQRDECAELARRAHSDAGKCDGAPQCRFCVKLAEIVKADRGI